MRRKNVKYRILAACLAASMVFTMMPMTAFAEEINVAPAGVETQTESSNDEVSEEAELQEQTSNEKEPSEEAATEEINAEEIIPEEETEDTTQTETQTETEQNPETEAVAEESNADTVNEEMQVETSGSEAIEALQSRIDALPAVDEFIAMADGTTVEDSTLNQAQVDVYNEAQAIAEEMDSLTYEEQEQLDTGKLEALFAYWNAQVQENAEYSFNGAQNGFTVGEDKSLTAAFTVTSNSNNMKGWLLCLMESKPSIDSDNKLTDSNDAHPYSYSNCKYYFFASDTQKTGNISVTWEGKAVDEKGSKKTLADVISEKDWYIVIGPRHYYTGWGDSGIGAGTNGIWENCDYYAGRASDIIPAALHKHNWQYKSMEGNCIIAECINKDNCTYKDIVLKCILNAESVVTYSGNAYAGASITNQITPVTGAPADVKYAGRDGTSYTESTTAPVNAGNYTVKATIGGAAATADFTIKKADITPTLSLADWVYGKAVSNPVLTGNSGNGTVTYFYKERNAEDSTYKEVTDFTKIPLGTYTLKASIAETENYNAADTTCDFAVTKQLITVNVSMDNWTYGDTAKTPGITEESNPGHGAVTYTYYTDSACTRETTSENGAAADGAVPENAGTYYVKAAVAETENYAAGSGSTGFTIAKKAVTAVVTAKDKTYDGTGEAVVNAVVADSDLISGDEITIKGIAGTFEDKNAGTEKKVTVDSSKAEYTGTGAENYEITIAAETKASIEKLTAELEWEGTDLTYTGNEQSVTAKVSNAVSGDTFTLAYEGNRQTNVGSYTAGVTALGNDNYVLPEADKAKTAWKISYLAKGTVTVTGDKGSNDWYVSGVKIRPETGYEISVNGTDWADSAECDIQGPQTVVYYLKETATGFISGQRTAEFKIDTELPTGEIRIKDNGFTEFLNTITFKYFFKKTVDVTITGTDAVSGIARIEYQKAAKGEAFDKEGAWTEGSSFSMPANDKSAIYARITDNAGHSIIINSDGIVVYTDATAKAEETFTRTSSEELITGIIVNGNTISSVKNGENTMAQSAYEIRDDRLVLKASYLQTLAIGTYTFTVSYDPYGEAYTAESKGEAPEVSVIRLAVVDAMQISAEGYTGIYDGQAHGITVNVTDPADMEAARVKVTYGTKDADGRITYSGDAVTYRDAGEYTVYYKVTADNYADTEGNAVIKIVPKTVSLVWSDTEFTYDGQAHKPVAKVKDADIIGSDSVEVTVAGEQKDAGSSYTAQAAALSNSNYTLGTDVEKAFVINPAAVTVTVDHATKHIGKADPAFTYQAAGLVKGETLKNISFARIAGETAGSYDINATAKDGSNTNYDVTFVAGKLTIEDHIRPETPVVENRVEAACTKDGSYDEVYYCTADGCKAELERVHRTIPATGHKYGEPVFTWSEDYSTVRATFTCANDVSHVETKEYAVKKEITKKASGTEKGEITYTVTIIFDGKTYEDTKTQKTEIAGSEEIGPNGGKITTELIVSDDMPKTEIKNLTVETAKTLLTTEELSQVNAGEEITIYLEANRLTEDAVSTADKKDVEGKLDDITEKFMQSEGITSRKQVTTGIQYVDLSLYKKIGNGTATKLKSTGENELEITMDIPDNLKSSNSKRTYYVIRVHETWAGREATILPTTRNGDTLTFKTDRFSVYAIAYTEQNEVVVPAKVTLNLTQATLTSKGGTTQLTATVEPGDAANKNVTWTSSNPEVATVDANGVVTAVANGTATITATTEDGGFSTSVTITVNIPSGDDKDDSKKGDNTGKDNSDTGKDNSNTDNSGNGSTTTSDSKGSVTDTGADTRNITSPKTGDSSAIWTTLFMVSCAGLAVVLVKRKKENYK